MEEYVMEVERPKWAQGKTIDEEGFCRDFLVRYPLVYAEGSFFSPEGRVPEERIRKLIYDYLHRIVTSGIAKKASTLLEVLKLECRKEEMPVSEVLIDCANGTYHVGKQTFSDRKECCRCRLPVNYNPAAPEPKLWLSFLEELLEGEDILTLQEFMGYCLVPVNYAQKMLMIIGQGGEGKSRIGIIARHLLGDTMVNGSLTKLENNAFARADLQNRLLLVDDDLQLEALTTTGNIKSIVTAEQPLDLERKGVQSYQGLLFCRLMAFGNGNLRALHDRSHGFFRRQIILTAKPRRPDREDDPFLAQRIRQQELEGIFLWCLEGLHRLMGNDMRFTISPRAEANLNMAISEGNNTVDFMKSMGYIRLDPMAEVSSRQLYNVYKEWCEDNMLASLSARSFISTLMGDAPSYGIRYSNHINGGSGRSVRGFQGIRCIV